MPEITLLNSINNSYLKCDIEGICMNFTLSTTAFLTWLNITTVVPELWKGYLAQHYLRGCRCHKVIISENQYPNKIKHETFF